MVNDEECSESLPPDQRCPTKTLPLDGGELADPPFVPSRPLVLVGLMGAGKTSIGRALANSLGSCFVDADQEIERISAMPVAEIFTHYGEAEFRALERRVMKRLLVDDGKPCVIATGGGAFMNDETRALIRDHAHSIWLRADLDVLEGRTRGRTHRPLLNGKDPRTVLRDLMTTRYPVYGLADIVVDTFDEPLPQTTRRVLDAVRQFPPVSRDKSDP